jgi:hypothetical protein
MLKSPVPMVAIITTGVPRRWPKLEGICGSFSREVIKGSFSLEAYPLFLIE